MVREMGREPGGCAGHEEVEEPGRTPRKVTKDVGSNREITCNPASSPGDGLKNVGIVHGAGYCRKSK